MTESAWRMLSETWPEALVALDDDGRIVAIGSTAAAALGYSASDLLGKQAHDILCADTYDTAHDLDECPMIDSHRLNTVISGLWQHGNGEHINVDYRVLPGPESLNTWRLLSFRCLSENERSHQLLIKMATLCELQPSPLLEVDSQGVILFANPAMTELMLTHGFDEQGNAKVLPANLTTLVQHCLASEGATQSIESHCGDNAFLWNLHHYQSSQASSVLICGTDITARKKAEMQSLLFREQLEQEKEKARREYIAKMIHDLRSPLNAVLGFVRLLRRSAEARLSEKEHSMLQRVIAGAEDLARQISTTLELSRVESAQIEADFRSLNLDTLLQDIVADGQGLIGDKPVKLVLDTKPLMVYADRQLLKQAVTNLLANAIKFTEEGSIFLSSRQNDGDNYEIKVSDTGCGIRAEDLPTIFTLYQRTSTSTHSDIEGQGVGLAVVHDVAALHGGAVSAASTPGQGSTFTLSLPVKPPMLD